MALAKHIPLADVYRKKNCNILSFIHIFIRNYTFFIIFILYLYTYFSNINIYTYLYIFIFIHIYIYTYLYIYFFKLLIFIHIYTYLYLNIFIYILCIHNVYNFKYLHKFHSISKISVVFGHLTNVLDSSVGEVYHQVLSYLFVLPCRRVQCRSGTWILCHSQILLHLHPCEKDPSDLDMH